MSALPPRAPWGGKGKCLVQHSQPPASRNKRAAKRQVASQSILSNLGGGRLSLESGHLGRGAHSKLRLAKGGEWSVEGLWVCARVHFSAGKVRGFHEFPGGEQINLQALDVDLIGTS